jgi:hypothetical protein
VDAAIEQGISVFSVGVGPLDDSSQEREITGRQLLQEFAFQTGGQYYEAPDDQAIEERLRDDRNAAAERISADLRIQHHRLRCAHGRGAGDGLQDPATSTFTRCNPPTPSTPPPEGDVGGTPPPPPSDDGGARRPPADEGQTSDNGGGGGGAFGPLGLIAGLSLLALRRRLRAA